MKDIDGWILQCIREEKKEQRFCRKFYCAITVGAVAAVASVGVAGYSAYSQSQAQKEAAEQAKAGLGASPGDTYGRRANLPLFESEVGQSGNIAGEAFDDFEASLPQINSIAAQINAFNMRLRNKNSGGTFSKNLAAQGRNIEDMLAGNIPDDVADAIQRGVAERVGGGFDPNDPNAANSQLGTNLSRSLGLTSLDVMEKGMSYAPQWEQLVDAFTYKPGNAMADAGTFLSAAQLQLSADQMRYESGVNKAIVDAGADPAIAGSVNDNLRLNTAISQSDGNRQKALSGLITGGAAAASNVYNAFKPSSSPTNAAVPKVVNGGYQYNTAQGFSKV